jgi:vanillate O-demethylase monooxygenase subunit
MVAFADRCPHRLAPLSAGRVDGPELVCGYHGWRFVASGECMAGPGPGPDVPTPTRATPAWGATERHGLVWIAPEEPFADIIDLPEADNPTFDSVWLDVVRTSSDAGLLADAFLDTAHLPVGHVDATGADGETAALPYTITMEDDGFRVRLKRTIDKPGSPQAAADPAPQLHHCRWVYTYRPPFQLRLVQKYPGTTITHTTLFCLQPEDIRSTRVYSCLVRNDIGGDPDRLACAARSGQAVVEDIAFQERHPLDGLSLSSNGDEEENEAAAHTDTAGLALRQALSMLRERARRDTPSTPRSGTRYARRAPAGSRP